MSGSAASPDLITVVVLLAAGVLAVPLFRRLGLGSVLGYLSAGIAIGPFGFGFFHEPEHVLHVAELGVVLFLFVIGLEMQPTRLWALRRDIFGMGLLQVCVCGALTTGLLRLAGIPPVVAFVGAMGFVMTSTATVMQLLAERGETLTPKGQRIVAILLFEDLAIVPLLAIVALLAAGPNDAGTGFHWVPVAVALVAILGLVAVSRWLLNPLFEFLARAKAREVMTAVALLVVLGSALAMQWGGLSMAMGAFAAGVMLSESSFRHQLEADVEPFRGILMGLFFISVGMSLDLRLVFDDWLVILLTVAGLMAVKALGIYLVARLLGAQHYEASVRAALMAQGGEFAFVLYSAAATAGLLDGPIHASLAATVIISMALTPLVLAVLPRFVRKPPKAPDMAGVDAVSDTAELNGTVLIIGFGRFGQIASQALLARGVDVAIIDTSTDMIRAAATFGFKVYYGDGTRADVLRASGAATAESILVCVDRKESTQRIVELCKREFPLVPVLARAWDRQHAIELRKAKVDFQIRELFESALVMSVAALEKLGLDPAEARQICEEIRRRDAEILDLQAVGDLKAARSLMFGNDRMNPAPLTRPQQTGTPLSEETAQALGHPARDEPAEPEVAQRVSL